MLATSRQSISKTPPSASASEPTSGPISASASPVWKAPSTSRAPTVQELSGPTPRTGSEQNYANQPRGRDGPLPFHHVAVSVLRDSGGYPGESRARRRSSDQRRAFGLVALRAVKFRI